jgi:hypothetical protein
METTGFPSAEGIAPPRRDSFQLAHLARSAFRSRFKLADVDRAYVARTGWETLRSQAEKIVRERLAPAAPRNDGRQTPMRGHPVFIAQHATATCCRGCLFKWHGIPAGRPLSEAEIARVVDFLLAWIREKTGDLSGFPVQPTLPI